MSERSGSSTVGVQDSNLMNSFRVQRKEIPSSIRVLGVSLRVSFLNMVNINKFRWISNEKRWCVNINKIQNSFRSVKLCSKTSNISCRVIGTRFSCNKRKPCKCFGLFTNFTQKISSANIGDVISNFKNTMST